jgi:hypothetical protein
MKTGDIIVDAGIYVFHGAIMGIIKSYFPMIGQAVSNLVDDYNAKMANGTSFM